MSLHSLSLSLVLLPGLGLLPQQMLQQTPQHMAHASAQTEHGACQPCKRIGILPLRYEGPSQQISLYAQGTQDSLIHALSLVQSITLIDRSRTQALLKELAFQQSAYVDPKTQVKLGQLLGVDVLYTGSIQEVGQRLRILITEIDVQTGKTRALAQVTGPTDSLFELQDEIAQKILRAIHVPYSQREQSDVTQDLKSTPSLEVYALFIQGYQAQAQNDFDQAQEFYQQTLALDPNYWKVYYNRSVLNFAQNNLPLAMKDIHQAIQNNPRIYYLFKTRAMYYLKLKQYDKSLRDFNQALSLHAQDPESYYARGNLWSERKQKQQALKDYNKALELKNHYPEVLLQRGQLYLSQNKNALAHDDFQRAVALQPQNLLAYLYRGLSFFNLKEYEKALADFTRVIDTGQDQESLYQAYYYRGRIFFEKAQKEQAFQDWQKSCELGNHSICEWLKSQK